MKKPQETKPPGLGPDDVPNRRRYPTLGRERRTAIPPGDKWRADDDRPDLRTAEKQDDGEV